MPSKKNKLHKEADKKYNAENADGPAKFLTPIIKQKRNKERSKTK